MNNNAHLHYRYNIFYPILILISTIVLLLTVQWGAIPQLERLISFGLTLTSLFLSLIAIVFAIFSNFSFSKSSMNLQEASSNIEKTSSELQKVTKLIDEKITQIPTLISGLSDKFTLSHQELLGKINIQKSQTPIQNPISTKIDDNTIENFLSRSSTTGLLSLYACKLANEKSLSFEAKDFDDNNGEYIYGFLIACDSIGFIDFTYKEKTYVIKNINKTISEKVRNHISTRIKAEDKKSEDSYLKFLKDKLKRIDNYFKINS